ncbi:Amino acid transporter [Caligus rogercresseyi]|uniref:Amino acid transporter n=1 Tax=Caligus rogercresseyi TaxID=217165 RepID=A0A7T8HJ46_CALRO|nr:Amino acid transporter [Caligus rogercresseyi]
MSLSIFSFERPFKQEKTSIIYPGTDGIIERANKSNINGTDNILGTSQPRPLGPPISWDSLSSQFKEDGLPLLRFFQSLSIVMMKLTVWIIHLAPIGVCYE